MAEAKEAGGEELRVMRYSPFDSHLLAAVLYCERVQDLYSLLLVRSVLRRARPRALLAS